MEGPIVTTGAALGDNLSSLSGADYKRRMILIGCGAAGAISAIFKAPIAGLVFCIEVFALDVASSSIIALLISTTVACLFSIAVSGYQIEFHFSIHERFSPHNVPFYVVLGVLSAFVSVYFMRATRFVESLFSRVNSLLWKVVAGGIVVGLLVVLFPALYGEGYLVMRSMLSGYMPDIFVHSAFSGFLHAQWMLPILLVALALIKPIATAATTASGGVGGTFAPSLFVGCAVGYAFASLCNFAGLAQLPPMNFALAGMAGAISGIMAAPLTGIFLIAELTGGYELFIPLIIVSAFSTMIARRFEPFSIYTRRPGLAGRLITRHRDKAVLTLLRLRDLVEMNCPCLSATAGIDGLKDAIARNPFPYYPVLDRDGRFSGLIDIEDVLPFLAESELHDVLILADLVRSEPERLDASSDMVSVFETFRKSDADELPVFEDGKLIGFITRSRLYRAYREKMEEISDGDED